jgi:hypothetical protein
VGKLVGLPLLVRSGSRCCGTRRVRAQGGLPKAMRAEEARGVAMKRNWVRKNLQGANMRAAGTAGAAADGKGGCRYG